MKTILGTLLTVVACTATVAASPALLSVETTITERRSDGIQGVLIAPHITVESGKQASIQINELEYAVTPILLADGSVEVRAVLTRHEGGQATTLLSPTITAKLDQVAQVQNDQLALATKTTLAK